MTDWPGPNWSSSTNWATSPEAVTLGCGAAACGAAGAAAAAFLAVGIADCCLLLIGRGQHDPDVNACGQGSEAQTEVQKVVDLQGNCPALQVVYNRHDNRAHQ